MATGIVCWHVCSSLPFSFSCQFWRGDLQAWLCMHTANISSSFVSGVFVFCLFITKVLNFYLLQSVVLWITFLWLHFKTLTTTNHNEDTCFSFHSWFYFFFSETYFDKSHLRQADLLEFQDRLLSCRDTPPKEVLSENRNPSELQH